MILHLLHEAYKRMYVRNSYLWFHMGGAAVLRSYEMPAAWFVALVFLWEILESLMESKRDFKSYASFFISNTKKGRFISFALDSLGDITGALFIFFI